VRRRPSKLLVPLFAGMVILGLWWFLRRNPLLIADPRFDRETIFNALLFIACVPLILFGVRLVDLFAFDVFASRKKLVQAPLLLREIVSLALYIVAFAWAISAIFGKNVTAVLATGTVVAAVLGLALQETLGNVFAGIALHVEDSFSPGDVIRSGEYFGTVEAVRWRGTRLRTFNNNLVIIPNSVLAREHVEVYPRGNLNARILQIDIDHNVPPATVLNVLTQVASNVEGVMHDIPAFARVGGFGDSAVTYEIKYHMLDYAQRDRIDADIRKAVWYALRRNGISIPFRIRSLQRYVPPPPRHQRDTAEILHRLALVDVLSPLSGTAQEAIAAEPSCGTAPRATPCSSCTKARCRCACRTTRWRG
jgi:small-conductance mechanosensitive channel